MRNLVLDIVCEMIQHMGADFSSFLPGFIHETNRLQLSHPLFVSLTGNLADSKRSQPRLKHKVPVQSKGHDEDEHALSEDALDKVLLNHPKQPHREDWIAWQQMLVEEVLEQSPDHSMRCCLDLVKVQSVSVKSIHA